MEETSALASLDYQVLDFESAWDCKEPLDSAQDNLFKKMNSIDSDLLAQDPFLSSTHSEDDGFNEDLTAPSSISDELTFLDMDVGTTQEPEAPIDPDTIYYSDSDQDEAKSGDQEIHYEITVDGPPSPKKSKKTRRGKKRKPKANAWLLNKRDEVKEATGDTQVKLYEQQPFQDKELERCRKNALSAKINREKKKLKQEQIQKEMESLREENARLKRQEEESKRRARKAELELLRMRDMLRRNNAEDLLKKNHLDPEE